MSDLPGTKTGIPCTEAEWNMRVNLAAALRLAALYGWDEINLAHMSARAPDCPTHILIHGGGLFFEEVTASNLHCLDENGAHVRPSADMPHRFALPFHREIYDRFSAANCIIHLHTRAATAIAMQKQGLLMGSQYALFLGPIGYHDYLGLFSTPDEGSRLAQSFGSGQIVLQRGHGFVVWGHSVHEAFLLAFFLNRACETQVMSGTGAGALDPYIPPQDVIDVTAKQARSLIDGTQPFTKAAWAGLLRKLDRESPGYRL